METDIVELIKRHCRIEDIIQEDGYPLKGTGRYRKCSTDHTGGLVIDVKRQRYFWVALGEHGDVIHWVTERRTHDFKAACDELARRAGLPDIEWSQKDQAARLASKEKEEVFEAASQVFHRWFWQDEKAMAYVASRGFSVYQESEGEEPSTATQAFLGFTGRERGAQRKELIDAMKKSGIDLECPAAVAILGFQGDVEGWAKAHDVEVDGDWISKGRIHGLSEWPRLVYPHVENGRVRYLSTRGVGEKSHYNLPSALVGPRRMYFNHQWGTSTVRGVVVEGQADAITWGVWGVPAVALAGVTPDADMEETLKQFQTVYLGMDMDVTGVTSAWRLAQILGPRLRIFPARDPKLVELSVSDEAAARMKENCELANQVLRATSAIMRWPFPGRFETFKGESEDIPVKDSNDILRSFISQEMTDEAEHTRQALLLLDRAPTTVEAVCSWAGARDGAIRDEAMRSTMRLINRMDEFDQAQQMGVLSKLLQVGMRDLGRMLKADKQQASRHGPGGEPVYTWGGYYNGWLLDYVYDPKERTAGLAWRDPDGKIDAGPGVQIEGTWYEPHPPDDNFIKGSLYYPSGLGDKKSIQELIAYLEIYLDSVYIMPSDQFSRLAAYWILQTYLYDCFQSTIYLRVLGSAGAGKSEFLLRVGMVCYRMMLAGGVDSFSSLFRSVDRYKGTVVMDEADMEMSDTENEKIKFLNQGAFKGRPLSRVREITDENGNKSWEPISFQVFCPKMIGARKDFKDDAVGTRALTMRLVAREVPELIAAKIPLEINEEIRERSLALRNLLLRFRLENWQPEININPAWYEMTISARLNQVAGPLLAIARDDPDQQEDIRRMLREYYAETILNMSMTIGARVLEALWKIWQYPDLHQEFVKVDEEGNFLMRNNVVTRFTNEIITEMNATGGEEEQDEDAPTYKKGPKKITPRSVGRILREDFQLRMSARKNDGFWIYWNEPKLVGLSVKYGVDREDFRPQAEQAAAKAAAKAAQAQQPELGGAE